MTPKKKQLFESRLYAIYSFAPSGNAVSERQKIEAVLAAGADILQFRCKERIFSFEARRLCAEARALCARLGKLFVINDWPDVAVDFEADGLHVGQDDLAPRAARAAIGANMLLGLSTHSVGQARSAVEAGVVDYIGYGPIYATPTKEEYPPIGAGQLREVAAHSPIPVFAIGGINENTCQNLIQECGHTRFAVVRALFDSADPGLAAGRFRALIQPSLSTQSKE